MRSLLMIALAAGCLMMASCAPTSTGGPGTGSETVSKVQQLTTRICGFIPEARTVAAIVATFAGGSAIVGLASRVADSICNAVINNPMTEGPFGGRTIPRVNGVAVEGRFVKRR